LLLHFYGFSIWGGKTNFEKTSSEEFLDVIFLSVKKVEITPEIKFFKNVLSLLGALYMELRDGTDN